MAYTYEQLVQAYKAVHNGIAPDAATQATFQVQATLSANGQLSDAQLLGAIINSADNSTALAVLSYQFFTGKSPTAAGMDYLLNSAANNNDLNDPYYAQFSLENRYINFAANLGVQGEGAANFASKYGALSFADYVASIYQTIIGGSYAQAAGIDPAAAIASIIARKDAILATAASSGMITPNMTAAQIDLALKAATAGYLLGEAIKADVGLYAAAANNFMVAVAQGTAVYNTDITYTYQPTVSSFSHGTGKALDNSPPVIPTGTTPTKPVVAHAFILTAGVDGFAGESRADTFTGTDLTFNAGDVLNGGGGGGDTLTITAALGAHYVVPGATVRNIATADFSNDSSIYLDTTSWTGLSRLNVTLTGANSDSQFIAATSTDVVANISNMGGHGLVTAGGRNLTLNLTGATSTAALVIGNGTPAAGAVTVNFATSSTAPTATIVNANGPVSISQTASNGAGTTAALNFVTVNGGGATTSVVVHNTAPAIADSTHAGVVTNSVNINDVNYGASATGVIRAIDIDGFNTVSIYDTGLANLRLANGTGTIAINNGGASAPATTLNLTVDALNVFNSTDRASLYDQDVYTTMNVTTGATSSLMGYIQGGALTRFNLAGASQLTLALGLTATNLQAVTIGGAAGLVTDLSNKAHLTAIDASGTSGDNTLTITAGANGFNDGGASFLGGSGVDKITLSTAAIGKTIDLGDGDDTLVLASSATTPSVTVNGGGGTDTLAMDAADAAALSGSSAFAAKVTGFEHLTVRNITNNTIDLTQLGGFNYVSASGNGTQLFMTGFDSGGTLELSGASTADHVVERGNFGGYFTSFNFKFTDGTGAGVSFSHKLTVADAYTVNINVVDSQATPTGTFYDTANLWISGTRYLNITGNAGFKVQGTFDAGLESINATGLTKGGLYFDISDISGALSNGITVLGSSTVANVFDLSAQTSNRITVQGGQGDDIFTLGSGENIVYLLTGADKVIFTGVNPHSLTHYDSIHSISMGSGDILDFSALGTIDPTLSALSGLPVFQTALDTASAGDGSTQAHVTLFKDEGGAYAWLVVDRSASASFVDGVDLLVKLPNLYGAINLSHLSLSNGVLSFLA